MVSATRTTVPARLENIAERLSWAIERQPKQGRRRGLRLFQSRMEERANERGQGGGPPLVGCALSTIQGYVSGEQEPSVDFLTEAARVLEIRPAWLTHGDGAPTIEGQRDLFEAGKVVSGETERMLYRNIPDWRFLGTKARAAVVSTWSALVGERDPDELIGDGADKSNVTAGVDAARRLGRALHTPLVAVALVRGVIPPEHEDYVALVCTGISIYARGLERAPQDFSEHWTSTEEYTDGEA